MERGQSGWALQHPSVWKIRLVSQPGLIRTDWTAESLGTLTHTRALRSTFALSGTLVSNLTETLTC